MINSYEIKKINGEERLFLYFDYNFEFSKFGTKKQKEELIDKVNKYIIDNNINFKGTIISIMVGGLLAGNLIFNRPKIDNVLDDNVIPKVVEVDKLLYVPEIEIPKDDASVEKSDDIKTNVVETPQLVKKNTTTKTNQKSNTTSSSNTNDSNIETSKETPKEELIDNNTYVKVKRKNGTVETIELEEYLVGVVSAEMPALFHEEALKAQSVVARTYTLKAISSGKTLTDTESTQSYKDINELKSMWGSNFNNYYNKIKSCVISTKGYYLTYNGRYIEAVYHSTSNGKTEDAKNVWNNAYPYLVSVDSPYDSLNPSFKYEKNFTYEELTNKLGITINNETNFNILGQTSGDRVSYIEINDEKYSGVKFRNLLGLRSADFDIEKYDTYIKITTRGYGHGVGMSQYGANGMAKNGYEYADILRHYYKGVTISKK